MNLGLLRALLPRQVCIRGRLVIVLPSLMRGLSYLQIKCNKTAPITARSTWHAFTRCFGGGFLAVTLLRHALQYTHCTVDIISRGVHRFFLIILCRWLLGVFLLTAATRTTQSLTRCPWSTSHWDRALKWVVLFRINVADVNQSIHRWRIRLLVWPKLSSFVLSLYIIDSRPSYSKRDLTTP